MKMIRWHDPAFHGDAVSDLHAEQDFQAGIVKDWLYSPETIDQGRATEDDDNPGPSHGTCVASKAVGITNGVSKSSELIIVKLALLETGQILDSDLQWAFDEVYDDILTRQETSKQPIVVIAAFGTTEDPSVSPWPDIKRRMTDIFALGAAIIVPSGNHALDRGRSRNVDEIPALWANADPSFPLIVAGAVNNEGVTWPYSQGGNHVTIWAPGDQVQCADRAGFRRANGTSFATGMVSNLKPQG